MYPDGEYSMTTFRTTDDALKLYRLTPKFDEDANEYDVYCGVVVAASSETHARTIHPNTYSFWSLDTGWYTWEKDALGLPLRRVSDRRSQDHAAGEWVADPMSDLDVTFLGDAQPDLPAGIVLVSFAAG